MKITTSFANPAGRMVPYLTGAFSLLCTVALVVSMALFVFARQLSVKMPELEEQLARYRSREIHKPIDMLPYDKLVMLRSRVKELNELTSSDGQTLPILLSNLEKLIPDGVWLVSFQYRSGEHETKLVAEANHAELLAEFMGRLERSGYYSQVLLTRQSQRLESNQRAIQFEVQLRAKL